MKSNLVLLALILASCQPEMPVTSSILVKGDGLTVPVNKELYGLTIEEINHAVDGGIYAELIQNRSFEDGVPPLNCPYDPVRRVLTTPNGWTIPFLRSDSVPGWRCFSATSYMYPDTKELINDKNRRSLLVSVSASAESGKGGVIAEGYGGIPLRKGEKYDLSFYMKGASMASLEFKTTRPVKVVYTIDGTEPTPESTAYSAPIEFTESGVLKIRSVLPSGKMSKTRTITVEKQALAPAKEVAKTTPGLEMQVTDGMFLNSSKLGDVKEWKKSVIKDLREITSVVKSSESMRGVKQYAAIATGYVNIPEDGVYYISSDNEEVWIDGKLLVNNAGEVKRFSRHDSSAALSKGLHEIKVVFLGHIIGGWPSNWNDGSVKLRKADTDKFVKITPEMLVH